MYIYCSTLFSTLIQDPNSWGDATHRELGLPISINIIKAITLKYIHRPPWPRQSCIETPFLGDYRLAHLDRTAQHSLLLVSFFACGCPVIGGSFVIDWFSCILLPLPLCQILIDFIMCDLYLLSLFYDINQSVYSLLITIM